MRTLSRALGLLLLPVALAACTGSESTSTDQAPVVDLPGDDEGPVLAEVAGVRITAREFESAAARKVPADGIALSDAEKSEILDELIVEKMLYLEAKERGIDRDPKVQKVMVNTLLRQEVYSSVRNSDFTQEELRAYFDAHKDEFVVPEKVQVRRIFVKAEPTRTDAEAKGLAETLYARVSADPAAFREIASESSEDPYRRRGGDLGYMSIEGKPGIDPAIVERAFELEVGEVAVPFRAGGGYNVVLVSGRRDRVERTFEQMKGSVLRKVKNDRYKELYAEYVDGIRADYGVNIEKKLLDELDVRPARRLSLGPGMGAPDVGDDEDEEAEDFPE